jgi:hypothetical protein
MQACRLYLDPVGLDPSSKGAKRLIESTAEVGQLVERCGVDTPGIETSADQPVALGPS